MQRRIFAPKSPHVPGMLAAASIVVLAWLVGPQFSPRAAAADPLPFAVVSGTYTKTIRPLLTRYCLKCHNPNKHEGDLNLERIRSLTDIRRDPGVWEKVLFMLVNGEMPPADSDPLPAAADRQVQSWVRDYLNAEARANAGDPGRVVLRRLNNVEYTNTLRALTGVGLHPAAEFPTDSAAGEGFTNTGDSLVMSPALLDKYLAAARKIADHAVLLPDGFRFSRSETRRDWTDEIVEQIRDLHSRHTQLFEERDRGNVTRIQWGRVDLVPYIRVLLQHRERLRTEPAAATAIAASESLNGPYLERLAKLLREPVPSPVLARIQAQLVAAKPDDTATVIAAIETWQDRLWKLQNVGQMFNKGLTPVNPLVDKQPLRMKLKPTVGSEVVTLSLLASDAGDRSDDDRVVWKNPRLERAGLPPLLLRDTRTFLTRLSVFREQTLRRTNDYLAAAAAVARSKALSLSESAKQHHLDAAILQSWMEYLNLQPANEEFAHFAPRPSKILLVVVDTTNVRIGDRGLSAYLRSRGHEITLFGPSGKTARQQYDAGMEHDLVIISESIAAADVKFSGAHSLKDLPRPIISFEPYMYDDAGWTDKEVWKHFGHTGTGTAAPLGLDPLSEALHMTAAEHPMGLGMRGKVRIYTSPYTMAYGIPGNEATIIATADAEGKYPATFVYDRGSRLYDGSVAPAARIGLFLGQAAADNPEGNTPLDLNNLSFAGHSLANAAVEYALDPKHVSRPAARVLAENRTPQLLTRAVQHNGLLLQKKTAIWDHPFLSGWVLPNGHPAVVANASDDPVRIPGWVLPHALMVHPTPTHFVAAGWRSPIDGLVRIEAAVVDAHPEGGNGQSWSLNFQQGAARQRLARGDLDRGGALQLDPIEDLMVRKGDFVSLVIGPRDRDWACDATRINLVITENADQLRSWNLAMDVSSDLHAGNPHPDRLGNKLVWYFFSDEVGKYGESGEPLPNPSLLTRWRAAALKGRDAAAGPLADQVTELLVNGSTESTTENDKRLHRHARSATSPLFARFDYATLLARNDLPLVGVRESPFGLSTDAFQPDPSDPAGPAASLVVTAPQEIRVRLPADLVAGREFVVDVQLAPETKHGSIQARVVTAPLEVDAPPVQQRATDGVDLFALVPDLPVVTRSDSPGRQRMETALEEFRNLFPRMMCCRTIVPLDAVVTLVQYHREDAHLSRLMLDEGERNRLDRLWSELRYVSQDALRIHESFPLFLEFASQVGKVPQFEPLREPIRERATAFAAQLRESEPSHLTALVGFAQRAFRRPLTQVEQDQFHVMYARAREDAQDHETAFRAILTRVLVSPSFLYRIEEPAPGERSAPANDWELATRLSYFLWSTLPDAALLDAARNSQLQQPDQLVEQAGRMMRDDRVRNLATEFACQWLGFREFDTFDGKNERQYPTFLGLRGAMYQEGVRFFTDLFRRDGSILEILDANHTFLNAPLAKHYGIDRLPGEGWQRVDGMKRHSRGGVLGMAAMLSTQSGATRTSPVLRGNWIVETLLGERLPDPPATVPDLPDTISREGLTVRQRTEKHVSAAQCARCHIRIDPFGFALESFDAIGRHRTEDLLDQPVDARVRLPDGTRFEGLSGLRQYLMTKRRDDFVYQFCRKFLGFSLGRSVQLSDKPLIEQMYEQLIENDYRVWAALEVILRSEQFRFHRGLAATREKSL